MFATRASSSSIKKVVVIGPECTGKSELSQFLATHFKTVWVEEYARAYLNKLIRHYEQSDLTKITHGQIRMEEEWLQDANRVLICDTNAIVVKVWSEFKYGACEPDILKAIKERHYDLYLLTYIDIPWQDDPQREHPDKRDHFFQIFKTEVEKSGVPYALIDGEREARRKKAIEAIERILV